MRAHDDEVELALLGEVRDFVAGVADQADFLGAAARLGEHRTKRRDGFFKLFLLQFGHFLFGEARKRHAGHVGHDGAGIVAHDVDDVEVDAGAEERGVTQGVAPGGAAVLRAVDGDADAQRVVDARHVVAKDHDRAGRTGEDAVRDGTEEEALDGALTARGHHDEVRADVLGGLHDAFDRIADGGAFLHGSALQGDAGGFEDLFGFVFVVAGERFLTDQAAGAGGQRLLNVEEFDRRVAAEQRGAAREEFERVLSLRAGVDGNENFHVLSFKNQNGLDAKCVRSLRSVFIGNSTEFTGRCPMRFR